APDLLIVTVTWVQCVWVRTCPRDRRQGLGHAPTKHRNLISANQKPRVLLKQAQPAFFSSTTHTPPFAHCKGRKEKGRFGRDRTGHGSAGTVWQQARQ